MKTERRDTLRVPIALDAMLKFNQQGFQLYQTRDISLDGVFVETGPVRLPKKSPLELALKIPADGQNKIHRFRAQVKRLTPHGAGLVFDRADTDAYAALLHLVFSSQPKGRY
jgi:hypothetical protein